MNLGNISVGLYAKTSSFDRAIVRSQMRLESFSATTMKSGQMMSQWGRTLSTRVTLPLSILSAVSIREMGRFDKSMVESTAIVSDMTKQMKNELSGMADTMSTQGTFAAHELGKAYFYLFSAGMNAKQSLGALGPVMRFAQAGAFDLSTATALAADAQSALGLKSKDVEENLKGLTRVTDVLVKANTLANATVEQFSTSLTNRAGAALKAMNKDIEEGVAVLAVFADQGVKGRRAGMQLSIVLDHLEKAAMENQSEFKRYGVSLYDSTGQMRNLADVVEDLERALVGVSDQERAYRLEQMGFSVRSRKLIKLLLGTSEKIREYERELRKAGGTTQDVADKQLAAFNNQMTMTRHELQNLARDFSDVWKPALIDASKDLRQFTSNLRGMSDEMKRGVGITAGLSMGLGPMLLTLGLLSKATGLAAVGLKNMTGAMSAASGAAGAALVVWSAVVKKWAEMKDAQSAYYESASAWAQQQHKMKKEFGFEVSGAALDHMQKKTSELTKQMRLLNKEFKRQEDLGIMTPEKRLSSLQGMQDALREQLTDLQGNNEPWAKSERYVLNQFIDEYAQRIQKVQESVVQMEEKRAARVAELNSEYADQLKRFAADRLTDEQKLKVLAMQRKQLEEDLTKGTAIDQAKTRMKLLKVAQAQFGLYSNLLKDGAADTTGRGLFNQRAGAYEKGSREAYSLAQRKSKSEQDINKIEKHERENLKYQKAIEKLNRRIAKALEAEGFSMEDLEVVTL
jgi:TP901 family phage tail tape measure protein